jgi:Ca-activated chloride channel family protein
METPSHSRPCTEKLRRLITRRFLRRFAFTVIEIVIVIAVIAILAAIATPNFLESNIEYQVRSKVSRQRADLRAFGLSTGGLTPVNDQVFDAEFYENHGTNPFIDTDDDTLLTFGLDVDTASYSVVRRHLNQGALPPTAAVRVEEFINSFNWNLPPPETGDFAVHVDGAPSRFGTERNLLLRIGIRAREIESADRRDAVLTFVIDTSGSMDMQNRLDLVKRTLRLLVDEMRDTDEVAIVVYGARGQVLMPHRSLRERAEILNAIDRLAPNGSTNAEEGLLLGYREARRAFREGAINRIILCSDGVANVGRTGPDSILERIGEEGRSGITLTTVGFGMGNFNDTLMEQLADRGDGQCVHVDSLTEARRVFVENLTGTLQLVAADARVQVDFNPETVRSYRLLGYENRDIEDEAFDRNGTDAGDIGAGHRVTALVELKLWDDAEGDLLGDVRLRHRVPETEEFRETVHAITRDAIAPSFDHAAPEFRLAACVAETAEVLRESHWARGSDLDGVLAVAQTAADDLASQDTQMLEFLSLLAKARDLQDRGAAPGTGR